MNDIKWIDRNEFLPGCDRYCENSAFVIKGKAYIELKEEYKGSSDHIPKIKIAFYKLMDRIDIKKLPCDLNGAIINNGIFFCCEQKIENQNATMQTARNLELKDESLKNKLDNEYHRLVGEETEKHSELLNAFGRFMTAHEKIKEFCDPEEYKFYDYDYWAPLKKN